PVRQKNSIGLMPENVVGRCGGGNHGDAAAMRGEHSEDVALRAVVDGDDMMTRAALETIAALAVPHRLVPFVSLSAGDFLGQVHPLETGPVSGARFERHDIELSVRIVSDGAVRWSKIANTPGQATRIHPRDPDQPIMFEPGLKRLGGAIVRWRGNRG